ncbi:hypothetical protein A1355_01065 [Methylomonas koyamae]|uniref:Uncharacterized protein n=1 Tax=Methylomonas koyamae TaxID=702114 RepID=A0A177N230_9GAMM|nr:hypothetical protein A1355_01065 [Methylomonas koyamae]
MPEGVDFNGGEPSIETNAFATGLTSSDQAAFAVAAGRQCGHGVTIFKNSLAFLAALVGFEMAPR